MLNSKRISFIDSFCCLSPIAKDLLEGLREYRLLEQQD